MKKLLILLLANLGALQAADDFIIYSGEKFTTPGIEDLVTGTRDPDITFVREFSIPARQKLKLITLFQTQGLLPAEKAIAAAREALLDEHTGEVIKIIRLEFIDKPIMIGESPSDALSSYLISCQINAVTEQRLVLMDGTVLHPTLKKVTEE